LASKWPKLALEKQVQGHLANGHRYFFQDEFQNALNEYQTAYSLLHKFLHPYFPVDVTVITTSVLKQMQLTDMMVGAAAQVAKYRSAVVDRPIVTPGNPPQEILSIVQKFGGTGSTVVASPAVILYEQASTYLQAVSCDRSLTSFVKRPHCPGPRRKPPDEDWEKEASCPAKMVATGMKLRTIDSSGDRKMIDGVALVCDTLVPAR
jgi:hypothetical protein